MDSRARMKEEKLVTLAAFKARAKALGYTVRENPDAREAVRPLYLAKQGDTTMGTFSAKYPKEGYLLA
jgi:hypothetical protein